MQTFTSLTSSSRGLPLVAAFVFFGSLVLYALTLAPGLLWGGGDFATFQTYAYLRTIEVPGGIFGHPLWVILAHPFTFLPFRDVAWRANFAAAVFAAGALGVVFLSASYLTKSRLAALLGAGALGLSHTFWTYAVMPKVYSLNALLLALCSYLLLRWRDKQQDRYLYLFAFLYGLSFLNHLVMVTVAAGFGGFVVIVLWQRCQFSKVWPPLLLSGLLFGLGFAPYLYLLFHGASASSAGETGLAFLKGLAYPLSNPQAMLKGLGFGGLLGVYQFPISTLFGMVGVFFLWRRDRAVATLIILGMLGTLAFMLAALDPAAGSTYVWNLHYYLQAYVVFSLAIAGGLGVVLVDWCARSARRQAVLIAVTLAFPVLLYAAAPSVARTFLQNLPDFRQLPGRDNLVYVLSPWKQQETGARDLGQDVLRTLPPNSVFIADYSVWAVIRYLQVVEKARPDVELVELPGPGQQAPILLRYRNAPNLFLADTYRYYDLQDIQDLFEVIPAGSVYRLEKKQTLN
ncbi:MAG: DUF2723 domain-containing protein [Chloroflexi bacterium]|nr:DUF2723 domain-containing protein [Chloroflexota bacterium]